MTASMLVSLVFFIGIPLLCVIFLLRASDFP